MDIEIKMTDKIVGFKNKKVPAYHRRQYKGKNLLGKLNSWLCSELQIIYDADPKLGSHREKRVLNKEVPGKHAYITVYNTYCAPKYLHEKRGDYISQANIILLGDETGIEGPAGANFFAIGCYGDPVSHFWIKDNNIHDTAYLEFNGAQVMEEDWCFYTPLQTTGIEHNDQFLKPVQKNLGVNEHNHLNFKKPLYMKGYGGSFDVMAQTKSGKKSKIITITLPSKPDPSK